MDTRNLLDIEMITCKNGMPANWIENNEGVGFDLGPMILIAYYKGVTIPSIDLGEIAPSFDP